MTPFSVSPAEVARVADEQGGVGGTEELDGITPFPFTPFIIKLPSVAAVENATEAPFNGERDEPESTRFKPLSALIATSIAGVPFCWS